MNNWINLTFACIVHSDIKYHIYCYWIIIFIDVIWSNKIWQKISKVYNIFFFIFTKYFLYNYDDFSAIFTLFLANLCLDSVWLSNLFFPLRTLHSLLKCQNFVKFSSVCWKIPGMTHFRKFDQMNRFLF